MTEPTGPLVEALASSPLRALLRLRLGSRVDRALVLLSHHGPDRVEHPLVRRAGHHPRPTFARVWRREFHQVSWVSVDARTDWVTRPQDGRGGRSSRYAVRWWVSDPVTVARQGLAVEDVPGWIAEDAARHERWPGRQALLTPPFPADTASPADGPALVQRLGISYQFLDRPPQPVGADAAGPAMPAAWGEEHHDAYRFYREVVTGGPHGLAALWLLHHPDQAREVLDWTVTHGDLLTRPDPWGEALTGLLDDLSGADRAFLGVTVAQALRDLGVAQAQEALDRLEPGELDGVYRGTFR